MPRVGGYDRWEVRGDRVRILDVAAVAVVMKNPELGVTSSDLQTSCGYDTYAPFASPPVCTQTETL
jgi:hypothetical protein